MVVDTNFYPSVVLAAEAHSLTVDSVHRNIAEKTNWNFFYELDPATQAEIRRLNPEAANASASYRNGRRVLVKDPRDPSKEKIFSSIVKAAEAYNINTKSVRKRCNSVNFPNWQWVDEQQIGESGTV